VRHEALLSGMKFTDQCDVVAHSATKVLFRVLDHFVAITPVIMLMRQPTI
jgi:hypothetical protein